ncbi:MAG TPA: SIR2 family protein [Bellilinea sp.]|mgnify:CR=1 FL=1|nr:SIR2 family protein [Bellilinea sp.]
MDTEHIPTKLKDCACEICQLKLPFDFPKGLLDDFVSGRVALFVGAGVSTENKSVLKYSLYDVVAAELGVEKTGLSFPDLMEQYAQQPNGRIKLLSHIRKRLDHIYSFPELYESATRFHRELSTLSTVDTIVTTNWDTYFEHECLASPFVFPEDIAFWDAAERRVLKIHGTIENYSSIVATRTDYNACKRRLTDNMIGVILKKILATKTVVFLGYSVRDDDFIYIMKSVQSQMQALGRTSYIVTLDDSVGAQRRYAELRLIPIVTDGTHFIERIKKHLVSTSCLLPDHVFKDVEELLENVYMAHFELFDYFSIFKNPEIIICACYQDGLQHGLERILRLKNSGIYSHTCKAIETARKYTTLRKEYLAKKQYGDVAYIDGYINAFLFLASQKYDDEILKAPPPPFYAIGYNGDIFTLKKYKKLIREIPGFHKAAFAFCKRTADKFRGHEQESIVMHHKCWL